MDISYILLEWMQRKNIEFSTATAMCLKNNYIQYVCKLEKMNKAILLSEKQKTNLHWDERITCESNLELYRELTEKHLHSIYQKHPKSIGKCLAGEKEHLNFLISNNR